MTLLAMLGSPRPWNKYTSRISSWRLLTRRALVASSRPFEYELNPTRHVYSLLQKLSFSEFPAQSLVRFDNFSTNDGFPRATLSPAAVHCTCGSYPPNQDLRHQYRGLLSNFGSIPMCNHRLFQCILGPHF